MIMLQYEVWYLAILYTHCTLTRLQLSVLYHSQYSHSLKSVVAIHAQILQISASGTETCSAPCDIGTAYLCLMGMEHSAEWPVSN